MARFIVLLMAGVLAVAGSVCQAQKVDFGVLAGLVFSHPKDYNTRTGFSVGAKGIYTFRENSSSWFLEAQAKLASKGWKYDIATYDEGGNLVYYSDWTCNAYYLEIPVYAGYKFMVNDDCGIFIEAGPYLAAGLFGKSDVKGGEHNYEYYGNVFADGFYERFDWGLGGNVGVEYRHVQISVGLHRSLMNPLKQTLVMMPKPKDRSWMLTIAYII